MSDKKELEQKMRLTDEMILIQGIVWIEQSTRFIQWVELSIEQQEQIEGIQANIQKLIRALLTCRADQLYIDLRSGK